MSNVPTADFWKGFPRPIIGLAPMDGVTDAAFRFIVSMQGRPDVIFTEFTNVNDICRGPDSLFSSLVYSECERPVVAQLYGKDPDLFYRAAHIVCELGFDGLDINMGCPSKNVASSGSGAGLIRTPELARAIIRAARQGIMDWSKGQMLEAAGLKEPRIELIRAMNVKRTGLPHPPQRRIIPLSVKTRLGYDSVIVERWIGYLLEEQPATITVHGRTLEQMYRGEADWRAIGRAADVVQGTNTVLIGNGDLQSMCDVIRRVRETRVHGVLVGRSTLGRPWFFRTKEAARAAVDCSGLAGSDAVGPLEIDLDLPVRFRVMLDHARIFETFFGKERFPCMRKHLGWYCKSFRYAAAMRGSMVRASSSLDVERILAAYADCASSSSDCPSRFPLESQPQSSAPCV